MTPQDLGFPLHFESFRPAQLEAFEHGLTSDKRFTGIGAPPGVGKSGIAYGFAKLLGGRSVFLTADKGLQDQYASAGFGGLIDMRGRSNYTCWEGGDCEEGARLECKDHAGCPYRNQLRAFNLSDQGLTNYAWWMAVNQYSNGSEIPDTLICDEAHLMFDWLCAAMDFHFTERELRDCEYLKRADSVPDDTVRGWQARCALIQAAAVQQYEEAKTRAKNNRTDRAKVQLRKAEKFLERANRLPGIDAENWVCTLHEGTDDGRMWTFECVWPFKYREKIFRNVPRVILMSATMRPKTLSLLGISKGESDFREWGRQFPAANGPVVHVTTARVNAKINAENELIWLERIRQIVQWGDDRKGLIHTVSYARAKKIVEFLVGHGVHSSRLVVNGAADPNSQNARQAYDQFCRMGPGSVLISPSFGTGWDFKGKLAEWQIISKLPLVDTRSPVMQRRVLDDPTYPDYLAAQELVQACGRINRTETDRGTTLIIDDSWVWFQHRAKEYFPRWFKVRTEETLPKPLRLL
jgi:Rad3-related DNA helicase